VTAVARASQAFNSNIHLGAMRLLAGKRPKEDTYQRKAGNVRPEDLAAEDRARRIVSNDLENIPFACIITVASLCCLVACKRYSLHVSFQWHCGVHCASLFAFTALRFAHTIAYSRKASYPRAIIYFNNVIAVFILALNAADAVGCAALWRDKWPAL
jgi:hypothetical protein